MFTFLIGVAKIISVSKTSKKNQKNLKYGIGLVDECTTFNVNSNQMHVKSMSYIPNFLEEERGERGGVGAFKIVTKFLVLRISILLLMGNFI